MYRRVLLLSGALASVVLLVLGCVSRKETVQEAGRTILRIGYLPIAECGPLFVAIEHGIFDKYDLGVELEPMSGGAGILPAVQKGSLDIGFSNLVTLVSLAAERRPEDPRYLVSLAGASYEREGFSNHALLVKRGSRIRPEDFGRPGFRLALNTSRNIEELMIRRYLEGRRQRNIVLNVAEVPFPDMPLALARGDVDVIAVVEPFIHTLVASGDAEVLSRHYLEVSRETAVATYCATKSWISQNPETARRFRRSLEEATRQIVEDRRRLEAVLPRYTPVSLSEAATMGLPAFGTELRVEDVSEMMRSMLEYGFVETLPPPDTVIWNDTER